MNATEPQSAEPKPELHWRQYSLPTLLAVTAVLTLLLGLASHFWPHLLGGLAWPAERLPR